MVGKVMKKVKVVMDMGGEGAKGKPNPTRNTWNTWNMWNTWNQHARAQALKIPLFAFFSIPLFLLSRVRISVRGHLSVGGVVSDMESPRIIPTNPRTTPEMSS